MDQNDVLALLEVAGRPVRVIELTSALDADPTGVVDVVDQLIRAGRVAETERGLVLSESDDSTVSPAHKDVAAELWAKTLVGMGADRTEAGLAFARAGDHSRALEHLLPPALEENRIDAIQALLGETLETHLSAQDRGRLFLARAAHREKTGETRQAAEDLEVAARHLEGEELVDALGYAASVADDMQRPQQAETLAALAAAAAFTVDAPAKEGSLLTLHGRQLSRIGYPDEADHVFAAGTNLVDEHGTVIQKDWANWNKAWMHLDRGEVRQAEALFGVLRDHAVEVDDLDLASREAYWARSLFGIGHASEAIEAAQRAQDLAISLEARAPEFLADLALLEGALCFHRYDEALSHSDDALEVVREALPVWENVVFIGRARAFVGLGELGAAREAIQEALSATPSGPDGWRLRLQATEVLLSLTPAEEKWSQIQAEDLTDELLRARWFATAARLMIERARREGDTGLGLEAAGLAVQLGNPMLAADAIDAAGMWDEQASVPIARAVQAMKPHVPPEWEEQWEAIPAIAAALAVDTSEDVDENPLRQHIDEAMKAAGLAGVDVVLSPAQRAAGGQVRRRARRERRVLRSMANAAAVILLAVGSVYLFDQITEPLPPPVSIEETQVPRPPEGVFGASPYRGGPERTGVVEGSIEKATGYHWMGRPGGLFGTPPVTYGNLLVVASSTSDELSYISQDTGRVNGTISTRDRVRSAPAFDPSDPVHLVFGADDELVYVGDLVNWDNPLRDSMVVDGKVSASPLVTGDTAIVVTENGVVRAVGLSDSGQSGGFGPELGTSTTEARDWTYTGTEVVPLGNVNTSPASDGTSVYVVDIRGILHVIDIATGDPRCPSPIQLNGRLAPGSNPIISGDVVYLPAGAFLDRLQIGECLLMNPFATLRDDLFLVPPVIDGTVMYAVQGPSLRKIDVGPEEMGFDEEQDIWPPFNTSDLDPISTPPTLAGDLVYFGTRGGVVYAIDAHSGEELWTFETGSRVEGLAPVRNAVFVTNADGLLIAIAGD